MIGSNKKSVLHSGIFLEQKTARLRINRRNMPSQESVTDAKQKFINAVMEGTSVLMERCGYSRERATSALLRELSRGEFDVIRPTDEEIFESMKQNGLGIDEARKALTVHKALRRAMEANASAAEAIHNLASKIAVSNLMYESSDEDPTDQEQPEMRIEPLSSLDRQLSSGSRIKPAAATSTRKQKAAGLNKFAKTKKTPNNNTKATGRKRSIDEVEKKDSQTSRDRSDSVEVRVDAKMAQKQSIEEVVETAIRPPNSIRAKRVHRGDEQESSTPAPPHKRIRGSEG